MRRSAIWCGRVWPQCGHFVKPASNFPASCCAMVITTTDRRTLMHRRWLAGLRFELAVHHIVLEDCIAAVEAATVRRERLEAHIEAVLPDWALTPVVGALQAMRGMALVAAAPLVAELGDMTRFANPRQLMAYLGLVPSEHSSGPASNAGASPRAATAPPAGFCSRRHGATVSWPAQPRVAVAAGDPAQADP